MFKMLMTTTCLDNRDLEFPERMSGFNNMIYLSQRMMLAPEAGLYGMKKYSVRCNDFSMPYSPTSGDEVLEYTHTSNPQGISEHYLQYAWGL